MDRPGKSDIMDIDSIRAKHYFTCLWPGLSELWWRGRLSALPAAVAFAAVINVLLIAKFVYAGWLSGALVWLAILVVGATWAVLTVRSIRELPSLLTPRQASDQPDRFSEAHEAYLRGNYEIAEEALTATLAIEPRDPPALLLLAGVYRHRGRLHAAEMLLSGMEKLESTRLWRTQWESEHDRLDRAIEERGRERESPDEEGDSANEDQATDEIQHDGATAERPLAA